MEQVEFSFQYVCIYIIFQLIRQKLWLSSSFRTLRKINLSQKAYTGFQKGDPSLINKTMNNWIIASKQKKWDEYPISQHYQRWTDIKSSSVSHVVYPLNTSNLNESGDKNNPQKTQWPFEPILLIIKIWWEWLYFSPCCWSGMLLMMSESPGNARERHYLQNNAFIYLFNNAQDISFHSDNLDFNFWNSAKHTSNLLNLHQLWHINDLLV